MMTFEYVLTQMAHCSIEHTMTGAFRNVLVTR